MEDRVKMLVAELFRDAPRSGKTLELRDEMEQNLLDRYGDLLADGKTPDEAFEEIRSSVGDMSELFEEIERSSVYERRAYGEPERMPEHPASETAGKEIWHDASEPTGPETRPDASEPTGPETRPDASEAAGQAWSESEPDASAEERRAEPSAVSEQPDGSDTGTDGAPTASPPSDAQNGSGAAGGGMSAKRRRKIAGSLIGAMWCLVTALYFVVSFATGWWHLTWTMFLMGAGLSCIISYFAGERGSDGRRHVGALNGAMWCLITALYFIMSFQTGAWGMTWLIFPLGACLSSIMGLISSKGDPRAMWRAINGSFWSIVVLLYIAVSFATGLWHLTWVIFLVAAAVTNVMSIFRSEKS